jgi:hypothetical protein
MKALYKYFYRFMTTHGFIIIGFLMFLTYIYFRFIRERLPKDIPFTFNILGFFITMVLCLLYAYVVWRLIKPSTRSNETMLIIIDFIFKPLKDFDNFLKSFTVIKQYLQHFIFVFVYSGEYIFKTLTFNLIFLIIPRNILINVFMIDIFYYHNLLYIYKVLFISILLFLRRYIIYSIKNLSNLYYTEVKLYLESIQTPYEYGVHPSEWPENYDPENEDNDEWPPSMSLPLDIYIAFYVKQKVYEDKIYPCEYSNTTTAFDLLYPFKGKNNSNDFRHEKRKELEQSLEKLLQLYVVLEFENKHNTSNIHLKNAKIIIFILYLICWVYILLISFHTLNITELFIVMNLTWVEVLDPFSNIQIITLEETHYLQTLLHNIIQK